MTINMQPTHDNLKKLSCPFCGSQPEIWDAGQLVLDDKRFMVLCENSECLVQPHTQFFSTIKAAVTAWNKRNDDPS